MEIRNQKELRRQAAAALADNPGNPRQTVLLYAVITALCGVVSSVLTMVLDARIANTGGLGNMGLRSILTTIRQVVPLALTIGLLGLDLGYRGAALKMARRQAVQPKTLLMGYPKLGVLIRAMFLQGALYFLLMIVAVNAGSMIFMLTPFAQAVYDLVLPLAMDTDALYNALYSDPAFLNQMFHAMLPVFPIVLVLFLVVAAPVFYRYRMVRFCLLESPGHSALAAMAESSRMTKGSRWALVKLDLGFWWFFLGQMLCSVILYGDVLCEKLGVALPVGGTAAYYIFYITGLALECGLYYLALNRVHTTYACAYEALRPQTQPTQGGVVLGNIFDLAKKYRDEQ